MGGARVVLPIPLFSCNGTASTSKTHLLKIPVRTIHVFLRASLYGPPQEKTAFADSTRRGIEMRSISVQSRNKMLVLCSLLLEVAGFRVILRGQPIDGMLLVLFGMTFCMMIVVSDSLMGMPTISDPLPADHDFVRNQLLAEHLRRRPTIRSRWRRI